MSEQNGHQYTRAGNAAARRAHRNKSVRPLKGRPFRGSILKKGMDLFSLRAAARACADHRTPSVKKAQRLSEASDRILCIPH